MASRQARRIAGCFMVFLTHHVSEGSTSIG
jgi:hypothetical protein